MKPIVTIIAGLASLAIANPTPSLLAPNSLLPLNLVCSIDKITTPGIPLVGFFPSANYLGKIGGPLLRALIGEEYLEKLDAIADFLCVNSQDEPPGERGVCAESLAYVNGMLDTTLDVPLLRPIKAGYWRCLLNILCVTPAGIREGTCQYLLGGVDCVANRIIEAKDLECTSKV